MNYEEIENHCEQLSKISRNVIDEFLIYYAADKEKLDQKMFARIKKYGTTVREIEDSYINFLNSEFIAHEIFKSGGYIGKYLNHKEIKSLPEAQYKFLQFQFENPWRFSFAEVKSRPADNFFEMEDMFTGENYLLYSHGMKAVEETLRPRLWFNLIGFNGECWQTFGLMIPLQSFTMDDIFFFATELNPEIENGEMLMEDVSNNPYPYFMLLSASNLPVVSSRGFDTLLCYATDPLETFSTEKLSEKFIVEWNKNIYQLKSKSLGEFPHFATAYYDEIKKELLRSAFTNEGFDELTNDLIESGFGIYPEADTVVSITMFTTTEKILNKKIILNPYEKLFNKEIAKDDKGLNKVNHFLQLAMPYLNSNQKPDLQQLADQVGLDYENALSLWNQVKKSVGKMKR